MNIITLSNGMNNKEEFYAKYVTNHTRPYDGDVTSGSLKGLAPVWEKTFGRFLSENKQARIIDLGCGCGSIVWWLQQAGYTNVQGVDISCEQIETGRKLGVKNIELGDIKDSLRDKTDCYDVIFARDIIEHFRKEEIFEIISLCYKALKDGGRMIMQVPNAESPFGGRNRYGDYTHEIAFTSASAAQLMRTIGFDAIGIYPHEPLFCWDPTGLPRFIMWQVVKAFYKFLLYVEIGRLSRISMVSLNIIVVANKKA